VTSDDSALMDAARRIAELTDWPAEALADDLARLNVYGYMAAFYVWFVMEAPVTGNYMARRKVLRTRYLYCMDGLMGRTDHLRNRTLALDHFRCRNCEYSTYTFSDLHVDHILPRSRGGGNEQTNLQVLCVWCNSSKGAMTQEEWEASGLAAKQRSLRKWPECVK